MGLTWEGDRASNGWRVWEPAGPTYVVITPSGRRLEECPCCGCMFISRRAAMRFVEAIDRMELSWALDAMPAR